MINVVEITEEREGMAHTKIHLECGEVSEPERTYLTEGWVILEYSPDFIEVHPRDRVALLSCEGDIHE